MKPAFSLLKSFVCFITLAASPAVFGQTLSEGTYVTPGASHYLNQQVSFEAWGNGAYDMHATLVDGEHLYETDATLNFVRPGEYSGSGMITVRYSEHRGCRHRFGVRVFVEDDGRIFLRENTPQYIPFNPSGPCTAAGPYVWFNHPEAYSRVE